MSKAKKGKEITMKMIIQTDSEIIFSKSEEDVAHVFVCIECAAKAKQSEVLSSIERLAYAIRSSDFYKMAQVNTLADTHDDIKKAQQAVKKARKSACKQENKLLEAKAGLSDALYAHVERDDRGEDPPF